MHLIWLAKLVPALLAGAEEADGQGQPVRCHPASYGPMFSKLGCTWFMDACSRAVDPAAVEDLSYLRTQLNCHNLIIIILNLI